MLLASENNFAWLTAFLSEPYRLPNGMSSIFSSSKKSGYTDPYRVTSKDCHWNPWSTKVPRQGISCFTQRKASSITSEQKNSLCIILCICESSFFVLRIEFSIYNHIKNFHKMSSCLLFKWVWKNRRFFCLLLRETLKENYIGKRPTVKFFLCELRSLRSGRQKAGRVRGM